MNETLTRTVGYYSSIPKYEKPIGIKFHLADGTEKVVYFNDSLDKLEALRDHFIECEK